MMKKYEENKMNVTEENMTPVGKENTLDKSNINKKTEMKLLLKAPFDGKFFRGEYVSYLTIPENFEDYSIEYDYSKEGLQYENLLALTQKKKISRIISLYADTEEMGYMAVTHLAMHLLKERKKNGTLDLDEEDIVIDETEDEFEDDFARLSKDEQRWKESPYCVPIIDLDEVYQYFTRETKSFHTSNNHVYCEQDVISHEAPYWRSFYSEAVCILVTKENAQYKKLEFLSKVFRNQTMFVLFIDMKDQSSNDEHFSFHSVDSEEFDAIRNSFILANACDSAIISFGNANSKNFYKNVLKESIKEKGFKVNRGFPYERVLNLAISINKNALCGMIEKIINYAIKDFTETDVPVLKSEHFCFIDSFMRSQIDKEEKANASVLLNENLVGMEDIKQQVQDVVNVMKYNKLREKMKISGSRFHNVHVMLGAPGTAKTTVARYMGEMMFDEKLLKDNRFICINGAELKGKYVGHSAPKVQSIFRNHDVIIIDEAYSIVEEDGTTDSFSNEAISQLIIELENHSEDKLIIFAGYGGDVSEKNNRMQAFLDSNPGIKSRITSTFYFKSYSPKEMVQIFERIARNSNYTLQKGYEAFVENFFKTRVGMDDFGNGREARVLLETAVLFAAKRTMAQGKVKYTKKDLTELMLEDIEAAALKMKESFGCIKAQVKNIGFFAA